MNTDQLAFSGVVVTYNEAELLPQCLDSIDFCKDLVVVDLGSVDESVEIARRYGARIFQHELVPYPNLPRQLGFSQARYPWIVTIDPDEVFPKADLHVIESVLRRDPSIAGIRIPWQFYFRNKELRSSVWGRPDATWCAIVNRDRISTTPYVHKEFTYENNVVKLGRSEIAPLRHYWMQSYSQLVGKMRRYARTEGQSLYEAQGRRFTWVGAARTTLVAFRESFIKYHGWRGGLTGWSLTAIHTWYVFRSWLALRAYERGVS